MKELEYIKYRKKTIFLLCIIMAAMFTGCGKKVEPMEESEIKNVFIEHMINNYSECDFTDYDANITNRDTLIDEGSDYVNVWGEASNDTVRMNVNYSGYFYLNSEKEWQLGGIQVLDGNYEVLASDYTEEDAVNYISSDNYSTFEKYHDIVFMDRQLDLQNGKDSFIFNAKTTKKDTRLEDFQLVEYEVDVDRTITVIFSFGLYSGWQFSKINISGEGVINLSPENGMVLAVEPSEFYR